MMNILLTGLCLSGNKGGPALVSGIISAVKEYGNRVEFVLLSTDLEQDLPLADYYGVKVVAPQKRKLDTKVKWYLTRIIKVFEVIGYHLTGRLGYERLKLNPLFKVYMDSSLVINMRGVSFVGPLSLRGAFYESLWILIPWLLRVPVIQFTQTYGPFSNWWTRFLARFALKRAEVVMVREPQSLKYLNDIGIECNDFLFPDVAISMPAAASFDLPQPILDFINTGAGLVGISPSTRVIREEIALGKKKNYHKLIINTIKFLVLEKKLRVLLIPHTYKPHVVADDDYTLSLNMYHELKEELGDKIKIIEQDLPVDQLKAIISRCDYFIGSRYHSLVASLSTGVPSIAIGWSHKYDGLFGWFGVSEYSLWYDRIGLQEIKDSFENLVENSVTLKKKLLNKRKELDCKVSESGKVIYDILSKNR